MIHNHHKEPIVPQSMPPRKQKEKEIVDSAQTPPRKENGKEGKGEITDLTSKADRDSASQLGNTSSSSEEGKDDDEDDTARATKKGRTPRHPMMVRMIQAQPGADSWRQLPLLIHGRGIAHSIKWRGQQPRGI
jgi:hypothetical protein